MRVKPTGWFKRYESLGFWRKPRPAMIKRPLRVEELEVRMLLTIDSDLHAGTPIEVTVDNSAHFHILDATAQQVFTVDTVNDPQNGLEAVLHMSPTAPANPQVLYEFDVALNEDGIDVSTYHVEVVLPGAQMVADLATDHAQEAQSTLTAADTQPLQDITIDSQGNFVQAATITEAQTIFGGTAEAASEDSLSGPETTVQDVVPITSVAQKVDALGIIAKGIATTDTIVQGRLNTYAGIDLVANDIADAKEAGAAATDTQAYSHELGATLYTLATQLQTDMASSDPIVAAAAQQAYDSALSQSDLYFRLWSGKGINSQVYQQDRDDLHQTEYSLYYEAGQSQIIGQFAIDLGRSALVTVSVPQDYMMPADLMNDLATQTNSGQTAADTYVDTNGGTTVHGSESSLLVDGASGSGKKDSFLLFDLQSLGVTSQLVDNATLSLYGTSASSPAPTITAKSVPNTSWSESSLNGNGLNTTFDASSSPTTSWTAHTLSQDVDVTDAVRQATRLGDTAFLGSLTGSAPVTEINAFSQLYRNPTAYMGTYGPSTTLTSPVQTTVNGTSVTLNKDVLYRADADFDGQITSNDIGPFLNLYGSTQGDVNLDDVVNGLDTATIASNWLATNANYNQGDANMDGTVNGLDMASVSAHWLSSGSGTTSTPKITLRLSTTSGSAAFASANDTTTGHTHPTLTVHSSPVALTGFAADGTNLTVSYTVSGTAVAPFTIDVYQSPTGSASGQQLVQTFQISNSSDLTVGTHTNVLLTGISTAFEQITGNAYLRAVVTDSNISGTAENHDAVVFQGGVFKTPNSIQVQGSSPGAGDSISINSTSLSFNGTSYSESYVGKSIVVTTHSGNDSITVTEPATGTLPTITVNADGGTNALVVTDTAPPLTSPQTIGITSTQVRVNGTTINYSSLSSISVSTQQSADSYTVTEPSSGSLPTLSLSADGGSDTLTVDDTASLGSQSVSVTSTAITAAAATINYSSFESLSLLTGRSVDSVSVGSTPSLLQTLTLNADGGDDSFTLTSPASNLQIFVNGGGGNNTLNISTGSTNDTYNVSPSTITIGSTSITYSQIAILNLNADGSTSGFDSLHVDGSTSGSQFSISGTTIAWNQGPTINVANFEDVGLNQVKSVIATGSLPTVAVAFDGYDTLNGLDTFTLSGFTAHSVTILGGTGSGQINQVTMNGGSGAALTDSYELPLMLNIQTLDLSHNAFSSAPGLPGNLASTLKTLDLRYNQINLASSTTLLALQAPDVIAQLDLFGNLTAPDGSTNLTALSGKLLRVDLAPVGLDQAERLTNLHDALHAIAQALHYSPLEIYDYVHNNFTYQAYAGLMKGSLATIQTHAGNDWDQSQLLIDLLSDAGVANSVFNSTQVTTAGQSLSLEALATDVENWLGVTTFAAAKDVLYNAGLHPTSDYSSDVPGATLAFAHTFVVATIAGTTMTLDPSWKLNDYSSGITPYLAVNNLFDIGQTLSPQTVLDPTNSTGYFAPLANNAISTALPYEWYEDRIANTLKDSGYTMADLAYTAVIRPVYSTTLNPTNASVWPWTTDHWFRQSGTAAFYQTVSTELSPISASSDDQYKHHIVFSLTNGSGTSLGQASVTLAVPDISLDGLVLRWQDSGSDATPQLFTVDYASQTAPQKSSWSAINMNSNAGFGLKVEMDPPAIANTTGYATTLNHSRTYYGTAGISMYAIGIDADQINDTQLSVLHSWENTDGLIAEQNNNNAFYYPAAIDNLLADAISTYFQSADRIQQIGDTLFSSVRLHNYISTGVARSDYTPSLNSQNYGVYSTYQHVIVPKSLHFDIQDVAADSIARFETSTNISTALDQTEARLRLVGDSMAAEEHATWEDLTNTEMISSIKALQWARAAGTTINTITNSNWNLSAFQSAAIYGSLTSIIANQINTFIATAASEGVTATIFLPASLVQKSNNGVQYTGSGFVMTSPYSLQYPLVTQNADGSVSVESGAASLGTLFSNFIPTISSLASIAGDPVNVASGAGYEDVEDINIPDIGLPLTFDRHYDSSTPGDPTLGVGWWGTYSDSVAVASNGDVNWTSNKGQKYLFTKTSGGDYVTPVGVTGELKSVSGAYQLRDASGVTRIYDSTGKLTQITDLNGSVLNVTYNAGTSQVHQVVNVDGRSLLFAYKGSGHLASITPSTNASKPTTYTVTTITSPGPTTNYLTMVQGPIASDTYQYQYYDDNLTANTPVFTLMHIAHAPGGSQDVYSYYPNGRVFQVTTEDATDVIQNAQTVLYHAYEQNTTFIDERGNRTDHFYDTTGFETRVAYPDNTLTYELWNEQTGQLIDATDVYGITTQYTYAPDTDFSTHGGRFNEVATAIQGALALGATVTTPITPKTVVEQNVSGGVSPVALEIDYSYSHNTQTASNFQFAKVASVTLPSAIANLRKTITSYDSHGNPIETDQTVQASGGGATDIIKTAITYVTGLWFTGLPYQRSVYHSNLTVPDNQTTYLSYGVNGQPQEIDNRVDSTHSTHQFMVYDSRGFLQSSTDARGATQGDPSHTTTYNFDDLGRLQSTTLPPAQTGTASTGSSAHYNPLGKVLNSTDAEGRTTYFTYDALQRLIQVQVNDAANNVASILTYTYDAKGNRISQTDGDGNVTRYVYDNRDRLIQTILPDGHYSTTFYNSAGAPFIQIDPNGDRTTSSYDSLGHVTQVLLPAPAGLASPETIYTYDAVGEVLTQSTLAEAGSSGLAITRYSYDGAGRLTQRIDPTPMGTSTYAGTAVSTFTYDSSGKVLSQQLFDGASLNTTLLSIPAGTSPIQQTTNQYDGLERLIQKSIANSSGPPSVWKYGYDDVGNLTSTLDPVGFNSTDSTIISAHTTTDTYDNLNRLISQQNPGDGTIAYTYDKVGNIKTKTLTGAPDNLASSIAILLSETDYTYDALSRQVSSVAHSTFFSAPTTNLGMRVQTTYDPAGNVLAVSGPAVVFIASGAVTGSVDATLHTTRYIYDSRGRRTASIDAMGGQTSTTYDANGNSLSMTDPRGNETTYDYDALNRLVTTTRQTFTGLNTSGASSVTPVSTNVYDNAGNIVTTYQGTTTNSMERRTDYTYDNLHRLIQQTNPVDDGGVRKITALRYDTAGNNIYVIESNTGDSTQFITQKVYDKQNRLVAEFDPDPDGSGTESASGHYYGYDLNGNRIIDQFAQESGGPTLSALPTAQKTLAYTTYQYDGMNRRTLTNSYDISVLGFPLPLTYGPATLSSPVAAYATASIKYDGASNPFLTTDPLGYQTFTIYDGLGRVTDTQQLALGTPQTVTESTQSYDNFGNLQTSTLKAININSETYTDRTTTYDYDADGRQVRVTDPLGHFATTSYDADGNVTTTTDALNNTTQYSYDGENHRIKVIQPVNSSGSAPTTLYSYDEFGNLRRITDPLLVQTTYSYDALNNLLREHVVGNSNGVGDSGTIPANTVLGVDRVYQYNFLGHMTNETDHDNHARNFTYDYNGRLIKEAWPATTETFDYAYTPDGQLASADDIIGTQIMSKYVYSFAGDPLHRPSQLTYSQYINGSELNLSSSFSLPDVVTQFQYDQDSNLTSRTVNAGATNTHTDQYSYDSINREHSVSQQLGSTVESATITWDFADAVNSITRSVNSTSGPQTSVTNDAAGRIVQLAHDADVFNYTYDNANRVIHQSETIETSPLATVSNSNQFAYDTTSQLTVATHSAPGLASTEVYFYDANGNRVVAIGGGTDDGSGDGSDDGGDGSSSNVIDEWGRVVDDGTYKYQYDSEGNLQNQTLKSTSVLTTFMWDQRNRLSQTNVYTSGGSMLEWNRYDYDSIDNRITKTDFGADYGWVVNSTNYVYEGSDVAITRTVSNGSNTSSEGTVTHQYIYGPGMGAADQVMADDTLVAGAGGAVGIRWALSDVEGSIRTLVNADATKTVAANFNYDSFGRLAATGNANYTSPAAVDFLFGYAGGQYDKETAGNNGGTGLWHFDHRDLNPHTGQFLSNDPSGFSGGDTNLHRYVGNDPINATDPTGLCLSATYGMSSTPQWLQDMQSSANTSSLFPSQYLSAGGGIAALAQSLNVGELSTLGLTNGGGVNPLIPASAPGSLPFSSLLSPSLDPVQDVFDRQAQDVEDGAWQWQEAQRTEQEESQQAAFNSIVMQDMEARWDLAESDRSTAEGEAYANGVAKSAVTTAVVGGGAVVAAGASPAVGVGLLVGGLSYWAYQGYNNYVDRLDAGQSTVQAVSGSVLQTTPIISIFSGVYTSITDKDLVTQQSLGLSTEQRGGLMGGAIGQAGVVVAAPSLYNAGSSFMKSVQGWWSSVQAASEPVPIAPSTSSLGFVPLEEVEASAARLSSSAAPTTYPTGTFSITPQGWSGYPSGVPKPAGPFRLLEGAEYDAARRAADVTNNATRAQYQLRGSGLDIHEVQPVKFGGSPTDPANKILIDQMYHQQTVTPWWNALQRQIEGQ